MKYACHRGSVVSLVDTVGAPAVRWRVRWLAVASSLCVTIGCGDASSGDADDDTGLGSGDTDNGVTYDRTARTDGSTGSACGTCNAGLSCDSSIAGGYCTQLCTGQCQAGAVCYAVANQSVCLRSCAQDVDCRLGYSCQGDAGNTVCFPAESGNEGTRERPAEGTPPPPDDDPVASTCNIQRLPDNTTGGCRVRLVTPTECELIDLRNGAAYEFAWTTDGTGCETPWSFNIGGDPSVPNNSYNWSLSTNVEQGISRTGGIRYVRASDLAGLQSQQGVYQWIVSSFYGSYPQSQAFRVLQ